MKDKADPDLHGLFPTCIPMFLSNSNNHVQLQPFLGFYWLQDHMPQCLYFVFMNHGIDGIETMWSQTQQFEQLIPNSYGFLILGRNNHLFMLGQHLENKIS